MQVEVKTNVVVILTLSQEEAEWLHQAMQNPLHNLDPLNESQVDQEMRAQFWVATKTC